ncbi:MAG TPA: hypothetical protein VIH91_06425 [Terriglobales bacterium]
MSRSFRAPENRFAGETTMRHCSAWVLCALLLILCASAKVARYEIQKPTLKLATTQTYLDGEETLRKLPKPAPPLFWCAAVIAVSVFLLARATLRPAVIPISSALKGFDPESHLRAPPVP